MLIGDTFTSKLTFSLFRLCKAREQNLLSSKFICVKRHGVGAAICRPLFGYQHGRIISAPTSDGAVINFDEQLFCPSLASAAGGSRAKRSYPRVGFNRAIFPDTAQNSLSIRLY